MLTAEPYELDLTVGDCIAGERSEWLDFIAGRRSDLSAVLLETDPGQIRFYNLEDRWRFIAAHIASALSTPLTAVLGMTIASAMRWHQQAIRIDGGEFEDLPSLNKEQSA